MIFITFIRNMKPSTTPIVLLLGLATSCSLSKSTNNTLELKNKKNYKETCVLKKDAETDLLLELSYNRPDVRDEEYALQLFYTLSDTTVKKKQTFDLVADSSIIHTRYAIWSVWSWEPEQYSYSGTVEIRKWQSNKVKVKQDVVIYDYLRDDTLQFAGKRTYRLKTEP